MYLSSRGAVIQWRQAAPSSASLKPRKRQVLLSRGRRGTIAFSYGAASTTQIDCTIGTATALGLQVAISLETLVSCGIGTAAATGLPAAISADTYIGASVGIAAATGLPASISAPTQIACAVAIATATGRTVSISIGTTSVRASTSSRRTLQVSISRRPRQLS